MERPNEKNRIDQRIVDANIQLVDRNKLLEEDVSRLKDRINKAIEYLLDKYVIGEFHDEEANNVVKILKGEYVEIE